MSVSLTPLRCVLPATRDGIQLVGSQFANATAIAGNELSTLPDYPAEIRAPAGLLAGVSGFQISFGDESVLTPAISPTS